MPLPLPAAQSLLACCLPTEPPVGNLGPGEAEGDPRVAAWLRGAQDCRALRGLRLFGMGTPGRGWPGPGAGQL